MKKVMKKVTVLIVLMTSVLVSIAQNEMSIKEAKRVAENFLAEMSGGSVSAKSNLALTLQHTETDEAMNPLYYCFQIGEKGFMIVSAIDAVTPVLAYSLESNYEANTPADYLFNQYAEGVKAVKSDATLSDVYAQAQWTRYNVAPAEFSANLKKNGNTKAATLTSVEPLLVSNWNQDKYYNGECPVLVYGTTLYEPKITTSANQDYKAYVGCVAIATGQLMYYYRWPESGFGGFSYRPIGDRPPKINNSYEKLELDRITINFAKQKYDYDAMAPSLPSLGSYNENVAKMLFHVGVSAKMGYGGSEGSGTQSEAALEALKDYWRYPKGSSQEKFENVHVENETDALRYKEWGKKYLKPELDAMRPISYSGATSSGSGHAWNVDGYCDIDTNNTYYHCNWGWGGSNNGFFALGKFQGSYSPTGSGIFNRREAFFSKLVDSAFCANELAKPQTFMKRLTSHTGTVTDGAGNVKYKPNSDLQWIIAAPNTASYTFVFNKIKLKMTDKITVYKGATTASGIAAQYSGNYLMRAATDYSSLGEHGNFTGTPLPANLQVTADSVLIVFTSDMSYVTDYGFHISYTSVQKSGMNPCSNSGITSLKNVSGTISDKASSLAIDHADQDKPYKAEQFCRWDIDLATSTINYMIEFTKFDLKSGDYLELINTTQQSGTMPIVWQINRYSIDNMPPLNTPILINARRFRLTFSVDNKDEGTGFIMKYKQNEISIPDQGEVFTTLAIYPNPAKDAFNVELSTEFASKITFMIMDVAGKQISSETVYHAGGNMLHPVDASHLSPGVYFMSIITDQGKSIRKFVIQ